MTSLIKKALRMLGNPALFRQWMLRRSRTASFKRRLDFDAIERPHYGYGVWQAATQARALGVNRISVYEFGVAGGAGLMCLERVAEDVERETGVRIDVYGFDTGKGMPPPTDPRDLPFAWTTGLFRMRPKRLREKLTRAKLILGNVTNTVPKFLYRQYPAPIGFVSIDVDYYTSTVDALRLLDATAEFLLPRVFIYLDDVIGDDLETHCEWVGELAAVREFNDAHAQRKIGRINGLRHKRIIPAPWNDVMYVLHAFDHPRYNAYINTSKWPAPTAASNAAAPTSEGVAGQRSQNGAVEVIVRPIPQGTGAAAG
ncbi:MAG: hypothetical protein KF768_00270 [Phycisphaeraceae bacterium]|nr:hypothetical protein [Phycisphaeraceae bacterium]